MNIIDNVQDNEDIKIKVFAYLIVQTHSYRPDSSEWGHIKNNMSWFEDNTTAVIAIADLALIKTAYIKKGYGKRYNTDGSFDAVISKTGTEAMGSESNIEVNGKSWVDLDNIEIIANDFIVPHGTGIDANSDFNEDPMFVFTINKPIDFDADLTKNVLNTNIKQKIFFGTVQNKQNRLSTKEEKFAALISDQKQEQVIHFNSQFQVQAAFQNLQIKFYIGDSLNSINLGNNNLKFEIDTSPYLLIDEIKVNGNRNEDPNWNRYLSLTISTDDQLTPFKYSPIAIDSGKVSIYAQWWDYNFAIPYFEAQKYLASGIYLDKMFKDDANPSVQTQDFIKVIHNMILVAYLFKTQFRDIPRLQPSSTNPNAQGQIDPKYTWGSSYSYHTEPYHLINLADQSPIQASKLIYDQFLGHYGNAIDKDNLKTYNTIIASISKYIYAPNAIASGVIPFNEIMLPWYLEPRQSINIKQTGDNYEYESTDSFWEFQSKYFDIIGGAVSPKKFILSKIKDITNDKVNIISPLPPVLTQMPLLTNPAVMTNGNNANDNVFTKYISFLPKAVDTNGADINWKEYLLGVINKTTITEKDLTFTLPSLTSDNDTHVFHLDQDIINYVKNDLGYGQNANVQIIYRGDIQKTWNTIKTMTGATVIETHAYKDWLEPTPKIPTDDFLKAWYMTYSQFIGSDNVKKTWSFVGTPRIASYDYLRISNKTIARFSPGTASNEVNFAHEYEVQVLKDSYNNVKVHISNITPYPTGVDYNKKTIYTKQEWIDELVAKTGMDIKKLATTHLTIKEQKTFVGEIILGSMFNDQLIVRFFANDGTGVFNKPTNFNVGAINSNDETITQQKITFH